LLSLLSILMLLASPFISFLHNSKLPKTHFLIWLFLKLHLLLNILFSAHLLP
jgi:hypothetical protein